MGPENSATRLAMLDATERVLQEDGYAALSSRRVAEEAGLKQQLVYYYFRTMDDLILATFQRRTERGLQRLEKALESDQPLHALWELNSHPANARLSVEFMALANRNPAIRDEVIRYQERSRVMQEAILEKLLKAAGVDIAIFPPVAVAMLLACVAQLLDRETALGASRGHAELMGLVEWCLRRLEPVAPSGSHKTRPSS
jgi:AcrR family transcriptional regulator